MGIEIIGKLTQKNNGDFKLVDLADVDYDGTGKSAKQELENKIEEAKSGNIDITTAIYSKAINNMQINPNTLFQAKKAISNGELKVATWGDSITAGADLVYFNDCYAQRLHRELKRLFPNVNIVFRNYGIGSMTIQQACADDYRFTQDLYSYWDKEKNWHENVKMFEPDLLFIGFGMNDAGASGDSCYLEYFYLDGLINKINTWNKIPSICLIPTILPTTNKALYGQSQILTQGIARATREYGVANGYSIIDANRIWRILRDGKDDVDRITKEALYMTECDNLLGDVNAYSVSGKDFVGNGSSGKYLLINNDFYDGKIIMGILPRGTGEENAITVEYRYNDYGSIKISISSGTNSKIKVYCGNELMKEENLNLADGSACELSIDADGTKHHISCNNIEFTVSSYRQLYDGGIRIGSPGITPNFGSVKIINKIPNQGKPLCSELKLLGLPDKSIGGNAINHPTSFGHVMCYMACLNQLLKELQNNNFTSNIRIPLLNKFESVSDAGTTTTNGLTVKYVNLDPLENYVPNKNNIYVINRVTNKIYNYIQGDMHWEQLPDNSFIYVKANESTHQVIFSTNESTFNFEICRYII